MAKLRVITYNESHVKAIYQAKIAQRMVTEKKKECKFSFYILALGIIQISFAWDTSWIFPSLMIVAIVSLHIIGKIMLLRGLKGTLSKYRRECYLLNCNPDVPLSEEALEGIMRKWNMIMPLDSQHQDYRFRA